MKAVWFPRILQLSRVGYFLRSIAFVWIVVAGIFLLISRLGL